MSHSSSSSLPRRKYGAVQVVVEEEEDAALGAAKSSSHHHTTAAGQRRHGRRWRGLAAVALGAAVVGLVYNRQAATQQQPSNNADIAAASLVNVAAPQVQTPSAPAPKAASSSPTPPAAAAAAGAAAADELAPLSFTALNFYHIRDGKPAQEYPWLQNVKLIEPHRDTTLSVSSPRDGYEYLWEVRGGNPERAELRATASGAEAVVVLITLDENMVTLKEVTSDGEVVRQLDEMVMVKYVRREIRTLTDDEREELMDAMYALWDVSVNDGNGKEKYGDDYADIYAINRLHFKAAMNNDCDHYHDGLGFLTNHAMISNTFEYSLQAVNPKLTLPYWDFTIEDAEAEMSFDDDDLKIESPIFDEDWFGSADPVDNVVKDGRWAYTEIPHVYNDNPGELVPDVYGLLRSRWNVNSVPYLKRGMGTLCNEYDVTQIYPWPTCELHYWMATEYDDFASWVWESMYAPHGPVHTWIGGVLNCDDTIATVSALVGEENADALALYAFDQRKNFWRDGYFACEGRATSDQDETDVFEAGMCGCLGFDLFQGDDWQTIYYNSTINFDDVLSEYDDDTKREVVAAVCSSTIHDGDHLTAGSSLDPTFWPMHPTMERLFMFSVLTGNTYDMTWPDMDDSSTNVMVSRYGTTCNGHGGSDIFPFGLLDTDTDGWSIKTGIKGNLDHGNKLTNREVLEAMDARVNMLPYVYDTFKWDHCLESGYNFAEAWEAATEKTKGSSSKPSSPSFKGSAPRSPASFRGARKATGKDSKGHA